MPGRGIRNWRSRARRRWGFSQRFTPVLIADLTYYHFTFGEVDGVACLIARTGYTGEDGFELYFSPEHSEKLWNDLLEAGRGEGLLPCGLGARNTLRLEASMCLYGHEIDETTTAWEAQLGWICKPNKGDFLGRTRCSRKSKRASSGCWSASKCKTGALPAMAARCSLAGARPAESPAVLRRRF